MVRRHLLILGAALLAGCALSPTGRDAPMTPADCPETVLDDRGALRFVPGDVLLLREDGAYVPVILDSDIVLESLPAQVMVTPSTNAEPVPAFEPDLLPGCRAFEPGVVVKRRDAAGWRPVRLVSLTASGAIVVPEGSVDPEDARLADLRLELEGSTDARR